ncbi:polysaccharide biosynthesis/export family protein [Zooshikella ganghwensis]|uniref:polysaccharide biosynthesis/export family protein n=1 Tax=Zooshikella ganghwensis TaxID=202772 RepID=UPI00041A4D55|nr:polysaccharide biosynthesis/export family protein [Zooshikella ganghwensis]
MTLFKIIKSSILSLQLSFLFGCITPKLDESHDQQHWHSKLLDIPLSSTEYVSPSLHPSYLKNTSVKITNTKTTSPPPARPMLSAGDRIRLFSLSDLQLRELSSEDKLLNGIYEVGIDGQIKFPYLPLIQAAGLTLSELESKVNDSLEKGKFFRQGMAQISLTLVQWAPANIYISGAVFQPGLHIVNQRSAEEINQAQPQLSGNLPINRMLPSALRAAGGVRPNADISRIELTRGKIVYQIDLSGLVLGNSSVQVPLMDGDQIFVPDAGAPQQALMQPSAITPPGIRVYISNLSVPATSNANSAISKDSTSLPYGSRLLHATVSGNCAGGTGATNSDRYAILVTQSPVTQQPITIEREIEGLIKNPERLDINPYLMPNDNIVCYDSTITNFRDIGRTILDILIPVSIFKL